MGNVTVSPNPLLLLAAKHRIEVRGGYASSRYPDLMVHSDRGIVEFWQIDPDREWVKVGTLVSGIYQFATFQGDDAIVSPTFPELKLTAAIVLGA